jgi:hypothetical protein
MSRSCRRCRPALEWLEDRLTPSITIQFDYSHDALGFFNDPARRLVLQTAANNLTSVLGDNLSALTPAGSDTWTAMFQDPATGNQVPLANPSIPANTLLVFAGARALGGNTLGMGGPGSWNGTGAQSFLDLLMARGQPGALGPAAGRTDFGPWGGSVTFEPSVSWYFGTSASGLPANQNDFLSFAEHELAHLLGFGTAPSFENRVNGTSFTGPLARQEFGGPVPVDAPAPNAGHWVMGTMDRGQPADMDPSLLQGTRALFTPLDFAGLADLGWQVTGFASPVNQPPSVTANPVNQTVNAGQTATFSAAASGVPNPTVQWQVSSDGINFSNLPGATATTLSVKASVAQSGQQYRAVFTNSAGSAATSAATLIVLPTSVPPSMTTQPQSVSARAGRQVTFTVDASGTPPLRVQWQVSTDHGATFRNIAGATSPSLTVLASAALDRALYRAVYTNAAGTTTTASARLVVGSAPVVTRHPRSRFAHSRQLVKLTTAAVGNPAPSVQWQISFDHKHFLRLSGKTSATLSFRASRLLNRTFYRAVFTNQWGRAISRSAVLTVR